MHIDATTCLFALTHLAAAGLGALAVLLLLKPQLNQGVDPMASKFVNVLDDIGRGLKKFFTSPIAAGIETDALDLSEIAWPAATPLLNAIKASIAKAQTLAAAANVTGDTTAQVAALALSDAQAAFNAYQSAQGVTIETSQQENIIQAFLELLAEIPSAPAATAAPAPAPAVVLSPVAVAVQKIVNADPAPAVTAAVESAAQTAEPVAEAEVQAAPGLKVAD
jgi:hypothetical protein